MNNIYIVAAFTLREILASPAFRALLAATALFAIMALAVSNLFLLETVKVQLDFLWLGMSLLGAGFSLFIGTTLMGHDITRGTASLFLPHMDRHSYLLGRTAGLTLALTLLLALMAVLSTATVAWGLEHALPDRAAGISLWSAIIMGLFALLQSATILAMVLFTCSWATGVVEMMLFSSAFTLMAYLLPSVMSAITSSEVIAQVPAWSAAFIHTIDYLFPDMSGGQVALCIAHGLTLPTAELGWYLAGQCGYIITLVAAALLLFDRRDL
ncbi:hypothetical protein FE236_12450 [Mariprofundus erugo]|uniref:hypothetical protein n=1 Tax=Mariprofundus erugo TaxID=2528639 RepID=UPI0010FEF8AB|nr:hypothetical protein [Mariprofundus erugo]TLS73951.1 hypothetical protein FE236_12450 [Mariprofundus erugo]